MGLFHLGKKFGDDKKDKRTRRIIRFERMRTIFGLHMRTKKMIFLEILKEENYNIKGKFYRDEWGGRLPYMDGDEIAGYITHYRWQSREPDEGQMTTDMSDSYSAQGGVVYLKDFEVTRKNRKVESITYNEKDDYPEKFVNMEDISKINALDWSALSHWPVYNQEDYKEEYGQNYIAYLEYIIKDL